MQNDGLAESAAFARRFAAGHCERDDSAAGSCAWYHGFWPYLRLLGIGSAPQLHGAFFTQALAESAHDEGPLRLLISGAADEAMLALVLEALGPAQARAEIVLVDRCRTPLALSRRHAERAGFALATAHSDILDFRAERPFDVICTHSFLGYFAPPARADLVRRWHELLRPGGRVVTVNRVRPELAEERAGFSAAQTDSLLARVAERAATADSRLDVTRDELLAMARAFCANMRPHPVRSRDELAALFRDTGFEVAAFGAAGTAAGPSGPTVPGGADYVKIVARRVPA